MNVIVTGCDTGFGKMLVDNLLHDISFKIIALCYTEAAVHRYSLNDNNVIPILVDFSKRDIFCTEEDSDKFYREISKGVYCLINNAGVQETFSFDMSTNDELVRELMINYINAINITKICIPYMKKFAKECNLIKPRIVFVTSLAAKIGGLPMMTPYSATKSALNSACTSFRMELKPFGIKVVNVMPGFHRTPMLTNSTARVSEWYAKRSEEIKSQYGDNFVRRFDDGIRKPITCIAGNPKKVVKLISNVVFKPYVGSKYRVGWDAQILGRMKCLGESIGKFIRSTSGISQVVH